MHPVQFPESNVVFAKDQPEYRDLPAHLYREDMTGPLVCCWKLSLAERLVLLFTGRLWHTVLTFNRPLQPQMLSTLKPPMEEIDFTAPDVALKEAETSEQFLGLKDAKKGE